MSTFKVDTLQSTTGGVTTLTNQSAAKMFVNAYQPGTSIRKSLNASSYTDHGSSAYTITYTNNFTDDDYSTVTGIRDGGGENDSRFNHGSTTSGYYTTSSQRNYCGQHDGTGGGLVANDADVACLLSHGDLA